MIGALIGAAASIGGALLGSSSSKKAADKASDAQIVATDKNNALIRELYERNTGNFTPYMASGARANSLLDSFIYGGAVASQPAPAPAPMGVAPQTPQPMAYGSSRRGEGFQPQNHPFEPHSDYNPGTQPMTMSAPVQTIPTQGVAPQGGGMSGYEQFVASPYYQFPYQQGMNALNHGLASSGRLESGGAIKAATRYGADYGAGRMDEYLGLVRGQANQGFGAASALAGVGQNMVSETGMNNRAAADAISNAALLKNQANQGFYNALAGGAGFLSSYIK